MTVACAKPSWARSGQVRKYVLMAKIPTLKRKSLGQEVTLILRRMIQEGELKAGERLVEERLAEQLGLSRTPVREALHRLEQEALLLKRPRGGYEVRQLTIDEVEEVAGVRGILAAYAAERAATRITPQTLQELALNMEEFEQAFKQGDEETLVESNTEFHAIILRASESPILNRLLGELQGEVERVSRAAVSNIAAGEWTVIDHQAIYQAIKDGDGKKAAMLAKSHVAKSAQHLIAQLLARDNEETE